MEKTPICWLFVTSWKPARALVEQSQLDNMAFSSSAPLVEYMYGDDIDDSSFAVESLFQAGSGATVCTNVFSTDGNQLAALVSCASGDVAALLIDTAMDTVAASAISASDAPSAVRLRPWLSASAAAGGFVTAGCAATGDSGPALLLAGGGTPRGWVRLMGLPMAEEAHPVFAAGAVRSQPSAAALCSRTNVAAVGDDRGCIALHALARPDAPLWTGALAGGTGPRIADVAFWPGSDSTLLAAMSVPVQLTKACRWSTKIINCWYKLAVT